MKNQKTGKTRAAWLVFAVFMAMSFAFIFSTCDNMIGLGNKVNVVDPTIAVPRDADGSAPGAFITGSEGIIYLDIEAPGVGYEINAACMDIEWTDENGNRHTARACGYKNDKDNPNDIKWAFPLNSTDIVCLTCSNHPEDNPHHDDYCIIKHDCNVSLVRHSITDGKIKTNVTALDSSGRSTTTTDMVYTIKNLPPQIQMTIPTIKDDQFDAPNLNTLLAGDPINIGYDLMGLATDALGTAEGFPKIMIWPADALVNQDGIPFDDEYNDWHSLERPNPAGGLTATRFSWPMYKLVKDTSVNGNYRLPNYKLDKNDPKWEKPVYLEAPKFYRFRIWTQDMNGNDNFYPNRVDNKRGENGAALHPTDPGLNQFMEISYITAEIPLIIFEEVPAFYNGVEPFKVKFMVSSSNPLTSLKAWVRARVSGPGGSGMVDQILNEYNETPYMHLDPEFTQEGVIYYYDLIIPPVDVTTWIEGNLFIHIEAVDANQKQSPASNRNFVFDKKPPTVVFDRPAHIQNSKHSGKLTGGDYFIYYPDITQGPRWVVGEIAVGAIPSDENPIKEVFYHIGALGDDFSANDAQREALYKDAPWVNTDLHTPVPKASDAYGGKWTGTVYAFTYTCNFNSLKAQYGQEETALGYTNDAIYGTTGQSRFYLPFYVKVIDNAGNQTVVHYKLCIDPDLDIPLTSVIYPTPGALVGGEVRLTGNATDNNAVHSVLVRIKKYGTGAGYSLNDNDGKGTYKFYIPTGSVAYFPNTHFPAGDTGSLTNAKWPLALTATTGWYRATMVGDGVSVSWFSNINADNGLDPEGSAQDVDVSIQALALDTKDVTRTTPSIFGPPSTQNVKFSTGVPVIADPSILKTGVDNRTYEEGIRASGIFRIQTTIRDDEGLRTVRARINNGLWTTLVEDGNTAGGLPSGWTITNETWNSSLARFERTLTIEVNTITMSGFGYGRTGTYALEVNAVDKNESRYTTSRTFNIGIDNYYPHTEIGTFSNASGKSFVVNGLARDYGDNSGTVQGIDRVLVFFEKATITGSGASRAVTGNGTFLNAKGQDWTSLAARVTRPDVRDTTIADSVNGPNGPNVNSFANFPALVYENKGGDIGYVWTSPHAMVIDRSEFGEDVDSDQDGTYGEIWEGIANIEWAARFDSTIAAFADGPYMVHYIVMDKAGNATRYRKDIYIENRKPLITAINLGTDWDGNGGVAAWTNADNSGEFLQEKQTTGTALSLQPTLAATTRMNFGPNFRIRNNRFTLMLDTVSGNGQKSYDVSYVTEAAEVSAAALVRGEVYRISVHGGIDWERYGAPNNNLNTIFVATGRHDGTTNARAVPYNKFRVKTGTIGTGNVSIAAINFEAADFGATAGLIPDSPNKDAEGNITTANQNQRLFIIKVSDTTVSGRPAEDQLAHAVLIAVDIDNQDSKKPVISIDPFHWRSVSDNSLYEQMRENGHIELEGELSATRFTATTGLLDRDPKVSGKISVNGSSFDNNTVGTINFTFAGGASTTAATFTPTGSPQWSVNDNFAGTAGWKFEIIESKFDYQGHHVQWQLHMDTSKMVDTVAATDRVLTLGAGDRASTPNTSNASTTQTTASAKTPYYRMDVVPYISKISTDVRTAGGLREQNIRTADGKYSIRRLAANTIRVEGFNLSPTGTNGAARIFTTAYNDNTYNPSNTAPAGTVTGVTTVTVAAATNSYTTFNITNSTDYRSGFLTVWTNGIGSLNNINNNDSRGSYTLVTSGSNATNGHNQENMPNREADRYVTKNITLTDDRYLQFSAIFDTGTSNSGYPVMIMDGNNPVFGYVNSSGAPSAAGAGNAGTNYADYAMPQRAVYNGGTGARTSIEYLIKGSNWDAMGMARDDSGRYMHATTFNRSGSAFHLIYNSFNNDHSQNGWGAGINFGGQVAVDTNTGTTNGNLNAISLESINYAPGLVLERFEYPKLIGRGNSTSTTGARYYMFYYDRSSKEIIFRNFHIRLGTGTGNTTSPGTEYRRLLDTNMYATVRRNYGPTSNGTALCNTTFNYGRLPLVASANGASRYFDFDVTSGSIVVLVYYDTAASKLKLLYSSAAIDGTAPNTTRAFTTSSIDLPVNVGMYVSMVMDGDAVHIAANDANNGDLMYIYIPSYTGTSYRAVAVDKFGSTGNWTDIKLRPGTTGTTAVPVIAYLNMADIGSRDSNKVAWLKAGIGSTPTNTVSGIPDGADANGYTTGGWEYMTIPAVNAPQGGSDKFQKVNLGFRDEGTTASPRYTPVIGYLGTNLEFGYPIWE